ncbi:hypothetical protein DH2020_003834 [Rehmannia glutinosa]|uniref:Tf2-1-like SH3-like domain-containing protein n=1 Tax=Rehmannia glutinosa TaxID=99300 RepID=A0ABR0XN32_REHGL
MLRTCVLDFQGQWSKHLPLIEFSYNNSYQATIGMAPYEALYGRNCRSSVHWDEVGERKLLGPDTVREMTEAVTQMRQRMGTAQGRQKSYSDQRRRMLEFTIGDQVFLKVERIVDVAYRLDLPASMAQVHNVFHISVLRKYITNPSHLLKHEPVEIKDNLRYEEIPVEILLREVNKFRNNKISLVKVLWRNQSVEETAWEREDEMRAKYPNLFR